MKIIIEYESSWRNSFLDGSNNEPLPKCGRNFIGSMTSLKQAGNFTEQSVTKDTVMGILNRLIGDQRKLYQARQMENYYFDDIEKILLDNDIIDKPCISREIVYIRNVSGSTDQNSFTGLIRANDPAFKSSFSADLWGILWLNSKEIVDFILNKSFIFNNPINLDPITVSEQFELLNLVKAIDVDEKVQQALDVLQDAFPDINYLTTKKTITFNQLIYLGAIFAN